MRRGRWKQLQESDERKDALSSRRPKSSSSVRASTSSDSTFFLQETVGNQTVQRLSQSSLSPRVSAVGQREGDVHAEVAAQTGQIPPGGEQRQGEFEEAKEERSTFKKCLAKVVELIKQGIEKAKKLGSAALMALKRDIPMSHEEKALKANFGRISDDQKQTVVSRYEHIVSTLDSKEFECRDKCKKKGGSDLCGEGETPGKKIFICPNFGTAGCDPGQTILHESAHNAGASKDVDKDGSYPPKDAENNAYSYEYFPVDIGKGPPKVELPPKKEIEIKIPGE